jgi:NADPH:quinone reductase-like Zn-dependent oxidoreductase
MPAAIRFDRYGGPEVLAPAQVPRPEPAAGQVRLAVVAAGVNPVEWKIRRGDMAGGDGARAEPLTASRGLGTDVAGVVDAIGPGVTALAVGDEVFGRAHDAYAEHALADTDDLVARPAGLPWEVAASLAISGETAYRTLGLLGVIGREAVGTTLLVHGASGGVGTVAVQLAALRGARVIGTAGPAQLDRVRALGVEVVPHGAGWAGRVRALAPNGVDAVLDLSGHDVLEDSIALAGGPDAVVTIADRRAAELGVRYSRGLLHRVGMAEVFADLLPALLDGRITVHVAHRLPLAEAATAHRISEEGHPGGRIVLAVR